MALLLTRGAWQPMTCGLQLLDRSQGGRQRPAHDLSLWTVFLGVTCRSLHCVLHANLTSFTSFALASIEVVKFFPAACAA